MNAFNREYENDNSWEQLQEDEYGHLRPLVSLSELLPCQCMSCTESASFSNQQLAHTSRVISMWYVLDSLLRASRM